MNKKEKTIIGQALSRQERAPRLVDLRSMEKKFIRKYRQLPHLWDKNNPDYNNKLKRNAGYDALLPIFKRYMPRATRFHIRQKINILRSCYRKERRKYLASSTIDQDGNVLSSYVSHSWKYRALRFLDEDESNESDISEIETCPGFENEQELQYVDTVETESGNEEPDTSKIDISPIYLQEEHLEDFEDQKPFTRTRQIDNYNTYRDPTVQSYIEGEVLEKEFNAIGANVACKLQRMSTEQRYLAELLINKVLIKGLKESLTDETDLTSTWQDNLEESINYKQMKTSKKDTYLINMSKNNSRDEINNSIADHSSEIND